MTDRLAELAKAVLPEKGPAAGTKAQQTPMFRVGVISAKTTGTPNTLTVDARVMRCLGFMADYTVGDQVLWLDQGATPLVIGRFA